MNQDWKQSWMLKRKERKANMTPELLFEGIRIGDRAALSSAITLLESSSVEDQGKAKTLIQMCLPFSGNSIRIGITGVPGVGKSTFIETFGQLVIEQGKKLAVLAIDPSSEENGGSILGDKTRMHNLSVNESAFIRPSPAGKSLGGVARKTRESILLCEAAGYELIFVETVGVGQSETLVHSMVDFFLLLMLAGAGDELQGIKRGIMELADLLIINKADGDNQMKAKLAAREYKNALHLFPPNANGWIAQTMTSSSLEPDKMESIWAEIEKYKRHNLTNGWFEKKRSSQEIKWFKESLNDQVMQFLFQKQEAKQDLRKFEEEIKNKKISPFEAADQWMSKWIGK
jgi:LAO/AO transport system kinase